jgi:hypothetical protein
MKRISYLMLVGVALVAAAALGGINPAHANTGPAAATFYANSPSGIDPLGIDSGTPTISGSISPSQLRGPVPILPPIITTSG